MKRLTQTAMNAFAEIENGKPAPCAEVILVFTDVDYVQTNAGSSAKTTSSETVRFFARPEQLRTLAELLRGYADLTEIALDKDASTKNEGEPT